MKRILKLSIVPAIFLLISITSHAFVQGAELQKFLIDNRPSAIKKESPFAGMTIRDFISMTPKKYQQLTGKKLSRSQMISLKLAQFKVKKMAKKNKFPDWRLLTRDIETNHFNILGFILGIALGPVGVLIAYLIEGKQSSTFNWALYGAIIWVGVFLLVVLIL